MDGQPVANSGEPLRGEASAAASGREPYWDNVKGVCVLMVVFCHTLLLGSAGQVPMPPGAESNATKLEETVEHAGGLSVLLGLTGCIFMLSIVVMPGFTFISGLLSSEDYMVPRRKKALVQMGVTGVVMQLFSAAMMTVSEGMPFRFYAGVGVQWFLICLLLWRITLPFWMMLKWPLPVSVICSLLAMFTDSENVYFHSFLGFLPFFIAGHLVKRNGGKEALKRYRDRQFTIMFFSLVILVTVIGAVAGHHLSQQAQDGDTKFEYVMELFGTTYGCLMIESEVCWRWYSIPLRLGYYLLAVPIIPAFLGIIPERRVWGLTRAGMFSIYIYLIHIYLVSPWLFLAKNIQGVAYFFGAFSYAFALWCCLGSGAARPFCRWCVEPKVDWFLERNTVDSWKDLESRASAQASTAEKADASGAVA